MGVLALIPVSRDPVSLYAAVSSAYRVFEEYEVDGFHLVPSRPVVHDDVKDLRRVLGNLSGQGNVVVSRSVGAAPERARERGGSWEGMIPVLRGVIRELCGSADGVVVVVSPAGRWYAAALGVAGTAEARECPIDVVHVHFYFGPWTGLVYPYTPRRLHPIIVMHPEASRGLRGRPISAARKATSLSWSGGEGCSGAPPWMAGLPPLRCAVAETARRLNDVDGAVARLEHGKAQLGPCGRLTVVIDGEKVATADLCNEIEVARLAGRLAREIAGAAEATGARVPGQVAAWAGLHPLHYHADPGSGGQRVWLARLRGGILADTNLVYYGVHSYAWAGIPVAVPECAMIEVERRWARAAKHARLNDFNELADALAYLALSELRASGARIIPSLPVDCDVAIPRVEALLARGYRLATADDGAYRFWLGLKGLPGEGPVKVSFDGEGAWDAADAGDPEAIPYIYYSLAQALLALALAARQGLGVHSLEALLEPPGGEGEARVKIPVEIVEGALGLRPRCRAPS